MKNQATRLATLTFAEAVYDCDIVWDAIDVLRRKLREAGYPDCVLLAPEPHPKGHGWHVHGAVARYVPKAVLEEAWRHRGFVDIRDKFEGTNRRGIAARERARIVAGYVAGYVCTSWEAIPLRADLEAAATEAGQSTEWVAQIPSRPFNGKRFSCPKGQRGLEPVRFYANGLDEAIATLTSRLGFGVSASVVWRSPSALEGWRGPPTALVFG